MIEIKEYIEISRKIKHNERICYLKQFENLGKLGKLSFLSLRTFKRVLRSSEKIIFIRNKF